MPVFVTRSPDCPPLELWPAPLECLTRRAISPGIARRQAAHDYHQEQQVHDVPAHAKISRCTGTFASAAARRSSNTRSHELASTFA